MRWSLIVAVLSSGALLGSVRSNGQGGPTKEVIVTNTADHPVPVVTTNTLSQPLPFVLVDETSGRFQVQGDLDMFPGVWGNTSSIDFAGDERVMIIEHVSVYGRVPSGQAVQAAVITTKSTPQGPVQNTHYLVMNDQGSGYLEDIPTVGVTPIQAYRASETVRLYNDPYMTLFIQTSRNASDGFGHVLFTITGRRVRGDPASF